MAIGDIINTSTLTMTFDDEFNTLSSSPNGTTGLWRTSLLNGDRTLGSNGEQEYYSDSSVGVNPFSVNNGVLDIKATPGSNALGLPYNSGVITTANSFNQLYGYFEIDAKMPAGQGLWPAFWLLPASGAWPPELDAFEVLGNDPTTLYFSTHSGVQATQGTALTVPNVSAGFNLYGVMWGPKTVDLYINNVEVASMPTPADMNVPMYMLANLAVGGYWPGDPNSSTVFPANMLINYVHAYAYPGTTGGTVYDTTAAQNIGPAALAPVISVPAGLAATSGIATPVGNVAVASNWPGGFFTVVISDTSGLLQTSATSDVFTSGEGTNSLTLTGNLAPIDAALASLTYQGVAAGSEWIWITATDPQGLQSSNHVAVTDSAGSGGGGNAPVVTTPPTMSVAAGSTQDLTGISVMDSQSAGSFSVTVSDSTGLLNTESAAGLTLQGENSTSLTLTGSLAAINADLASLTYQAGASTGTDWLWVSTFDPSGKQGTGHEVVTVTPAPVLAASPIITTPAAQTIIAGTAHALTGISVTDSQSTGSFSVTVSDSTGLLKAASAAGLTLQGENSTSLTLTGSLSAINADLASLTYQAGTSAGADWLWVSAFGPGGKQGINHEVVTVTPAPVLAASPIITTPAAQTMIAGTAHALTGISVTDSQSTGSFSVTVSDSTGLLKAASAAGLTLQGENSTSLTLTGSLSTINADLPSLTYQGSPSASSDWLWVSANPPNGQQGIGHVVVTVKPPSPAASTTPQMAFLSPTLTATNDVSLQTLPNLSSLASSTKSLVSSFLPASASFLASPVMDSGSVLSSQGGLQAVDGHGGVGSFGSMLMAQQHGTPVFSAATLKPSSIF